VPSFDVSDELLDFSEVEYETRNGMRNALIAAPRTKLRLGPQRLERLRGGDYESSVNRKLLDAVDHADQPIHIIIFKAGGAGDGSWGFADELSDTEAIEMGYHLIKSQLRLYLEAADRGVFTVVGVEFGKRELAGYERGTDRLAEELERDISEGADSSVGRFNLWLIDHIGLWSSLALDEFLLERAGEATASAERHRRQIERLLTETKASND
jgi:hypothetical protein